MLTRTRLITSITALLLLASTASAGLFRTGQSVRIDTDTSLDENLNAAAQSVDIWGHVNGDVLAACRYFSHRGSVSGGILAAAQTIDIEGTVGGDLLLFAQDIRVTDSPVEDIRAACQNFTLESEVTGDMLVAAQTIRIQRGAVVHGDAALAAQTVEVYGDINGKLVAGGEWIEIEGNVAGDADLWADRFEFLDDGRIEGNLTIHYDDKKPQFDESKVGGTITWREIDKDIKASPWPGKVWILLTAIVTGLLLLLGFNRCIEPDLEEVLAHPFKSLGLGFLTLVVIPAAAILGIILVLTIPVSVMLILVYFPLLYVSWIFGAWMAGIVMLRSLTKKPQSHYLSLAFGVVLIWLIGLIPVVGGLVGFFVMLNGLGLMTVGSIRLLRG